MVVNWHPIHLLTILFGENLINIVHLLKKEMEINMTENEKDAIAYALQFAKLTNEEVKSFKEIMKENNNE